MAAGAAVRGRSEPGAKTGAERGATGTQTGAESWSDARPGTESLARSERVRRRPEFERAYGSGVRLYGRFMTMFVMTNGGNTSRFGVAATRKLGPAVVRNRAKRLAREVFRRHKVAASLDIIVVPRREMLDAPFATLEADYLALLARSTRERSAPSERRPRRGRGTRAAAGV